LNINAREVMSLKPAAELAKLTQMLFPGASADYLKARQALMAEEIEFRRHMGRLTEQRRALPPGPIVEKNYRFKGANGSDLGFGDLFGKHDALVTYFWMFGPQRERPCPMCTNFLGAVNGNADDIKQRVALKVLGRRPVAQQIAFALERGWKNLDFVQTVGDDFARDIGALKDDGSEWAAIIVLNRDGNKVRLFWSAGMTPEMADPGEDPRQAPDVAALWSILDMTPGGRGKDWYPQLTY
jgi:predicted dithiol-disulfide oxidoreductase (DUF899 family)